MRAEKVVRSLLLANATVSGAVANRVYPVTLPEGTALPAIVLDHVSTVEQPTIDANAPFALVESRISVTVISDVYTTMKTLMDACRVALNYKRGSISGVNVVSVRRALVGPEYKDDQLRSFAQSQDFMVLHFES
jgi:hypothetical protein